MSTISDSFWIPFCVNESVIYINNLFPKHLFWDMVMSELDIENDSDLIIPRALIASTALTFVDDIPKIRATLFESSNCP